MTDQDLTRAIESTKHTVLKAVRKHLPADLYAQAEDVAQETYLRYYLAFKTKQPPRGEELHRWLYTAAKNEALRAGRTGRRITMKLMRWFNNQPRESVEEPAPAISPEILVRGLPPEYREPALLRLQGMSLKEIGRTLKLAPGTVKSRLSRGRNLLQRMAANAERNGGTA